MRPTSARAYIWRARIAEWWANIWRWVLLAAGAALAVYFLLDRAVSGGVMTAVAISGLVIGVILTASKPMAIALMAMPALFIVERPASARPTSPYRMSRWPPRSEPLCCSVSDRTAGRYARCCGSTSCTSSRRSSP